MPHDATAGGGDFGRQEIYRRDMKAIVILAALAVGCADRSDLSEKIGTLEEQLRQARADISKLEQEDKTIWAAAKKAFDAVGGDMRSAGISPDAPGSWWCSGLCFRHKAECDDVTEKKDCVAQRIAYCTAVVPTEKTGQIGFVCFDSDASCHTLVPTRTLCLGVQ